MRGLTPKAPEAPRFVGLPEEQAALGHGGAVLGGGTPLLPIEVARAFGSVTLLLGASEVTKQLELMAEIRSVRERFLNGGDLIAYVGLRHEIAGHLKLIAAADTGLRNGTDTTRFVRYLGFQYFTGQLVMGGRL
jgi:hypothetical protein